MINIKLKSANNWMNITHISKNGIIKLNNNHIKIMKIIPINYNLKSDLEKLSILNSYKIFLKTCNFNIQILIQSNKEDLNQHISNVKKNTKEKKYLDKIANDYINYINNLNLNKKSSSKEFFIIISNDFNSKKENQEFIETELKEKYFKIKECLSRCGNQVIEINEKEKIINILKTFLNKRKSIQNI